MAKDKNPGFGDQDNFDDDWDSELDDFESGMDEFSFDDETASNEQESREPTSKIVTNIKAAATGAIEGLGSGIANRVANDVAKQMPGVRDVWSDVSNTKDEISRLKDDVADKVQPLVNETKRVTKKLLNQTTGMLPSFMGKRLKTFLDKFDTDASNELATANEREERTASMLAEIFKEQTEQDIQDKKEDNVNRLIDRRLSQSQHAENVGELTSIKTSVFYQTAFLRTTFTAYLKKNLEIQYKQLFVAEDTLKILGSMSAMQDQRLSSIVHNTALPDENKIHLDELVAKNTKEKIIGSFTDKVSGYLGKVRENILSQVVTPLIDGASSAISGIDMYADMKEMEGGFHGRDAIGSASGIIGSTIGGRLGTKLAAKALTMLPEDISTRVSDLARNGKTNVIKFLDDFKNNRIDNDWVNNEIADTVRDIILPSLDDAGGVENLRYNNLDKRASLTNRTIETIEQIIPGYLSMQTSLLERIVTGKSASQKVWDFEKEKFVTVESAADKFDTDTFGDKRTQTARIQYGLEHTAAIANRFGGTSKRTKSIISDFREVAADVEKFKINLATDKKLYWLDDTTDRDSNTLIYALESLAVNGTTDDNVLSKGFQGIKNKKQVATWLISLFTNEDGSVNTNAITEFNTEITRTRDDVLVNFNKAAFETQNEKRNYQVLNPYTNKQEKGKRSYDYSKIASSTYKLADSNALDFTRIHNTPDDTDAKNFREYQEQARTKKKLLNSEESDKRSIVERINDKLFGSVGRSVDRYLDEGERLLKDHFSDELSSVGKGVRTVLNRFDNRGTEVYEKATNIGNDNVVGEAGKEAVVPLTDPGTVKDGMAVMADEGLSVDDAIKVKKAINRSTKKKHAVGGIWNKATDTFTSLKNNVGDKVSSVSEKIKNFFSPVKTTFNKAAYAKYTTRDILIEQLRYLKEISEKPSIAVDASQLSKFGILKNRTKGIIGNGVNLAANATSVGFSAITSLARLHLSAMGGMLDFTGGVLLNKICDVYRKPKNEGDPLGEPLVTKDDFKDGLYDDPVLRDKKHRIKSVDQLTKPIYKRECPDGVPVISKSDIKAGLVDNKGKPLTSIGRKIGRMVNRVNETFGTLASKGVDFISGIRPLDRVSDILHVAGSFARGIFNSDQDVYSYLKPEECIISVKKLHNGLYMKKNRKGQFVLLKHISEIDGPVWCTDNPANGDKAGQMVLTEEDFANGDGLCDKYGRPIKSFFKSIGRGIRAVTGAVANGIGGFYGFAFRTAVSALKVGFKAVKYLVSGKDPYIDVYVYDDNNEKKLRLRGVKIREGGYFIMKNGEPEILTSAYGITDEVYGYTKNGKPKLLINADEIKRGLYDVDGNKLTAFAGKSIAGKVASVAFAGLKGIGSFAAKALWKGVTAVGRGVGQVLGLGKDVINVFTDSVRKVLSDFKELWITRKDLEEVVGDRLLDIYGLLHDRLSGSRAGDPNDKDGDGDRDGSYEDYQQKRKERLAKRKEAEEKLVAKKAKESKSVRTAADRNEDNSSLLEDIVTGNIISKGLDKLGGKVKSGISKVGKLGKGIAGKAITTGGSLLGKIGGTALGSLVMSKVAVAGTAITGAASTIGSAALSGVGSLASGASAALAGLGPVGWIIGGALAAGAVGYGAYKLLSDSDAVKKWRTERMNACGINLKYDDEFEDFEKLVWKNWLKGNKVPSDSDLVDFGKDIDFIKDTFLGFGGEKTDVLNQKLKFIKEWFTYTFAPVYATYVQVIKSVTKDPEAVPDVDDIEKNVEPEAFRVFTQNLPKNLNLKLNDNSFKSWSGETDKKKEATTKHEHSTRSTTEKVVAAGAVTATAAKTLGDTTDTKSTPKKENTSFLDKLGESLKSKAQAIAVGGVVGMAAAQTAKTISNIFDKLGIGSSLFNKSKDSQTDFFTERFDLYFAGKTFRTGNISKYAQTHKRMVLLAENQVARLFDGQITIDKFADGITEWIMKDVDFSELKKEIESTLNNLTIKKLNTVKFTDEDVTSAIKSFVFEWARTRLLQMAGLYVSLLRNATPNWNENSTGVPDLKNIPESQREIVKDAFRKGCKQYDTDETRFTAENVISLSADTLKVDLNANANDTETIRTQYRIKESKEKFEEKKTERNKIFVEANKGSASIGETNTKYWNKQTEQAKASITSTANTSFNAAAAESATNSSNISSVPKPKLGDQTKFGEKIWKHFKSKGWTDEGIAGMLGNLQKESGVEAIRKQAMTGDELRKDKDRSLSMDYTLKADSDPQSFTNPRSVGYGLAQWTTKARKNALLDFAQSQKKSVGDEDVQIDFLDKELTEQYKPMVARMSKSTDVISSTADFLRNFERPADQSDREVADRAGFSKLWLEKFGKSSTESAGTENAESVSDTGAPSVNSEEVQANTDVKSTGASVPVTTATAITTAVSKGTTDTAVSTENKVSTSVPSETMSPIISRGLTDSAVANPITTDIPVEAIKTQATSTSAKFETTPVVTKVDAETTERQLSELKLSNELLKEIKDALINMANNKPVETKNESTNTTVNNNSDIVEAMNKNSSETRATLTNLFETYFKEATSSRATPAVAPAKAQRTVDFPLNIKKA